MAGYVYILASKPRGTLYIGVTSNLPTRIAQHRSGEIEGFTKTYAVTMLVHMEEHATIPLAIQREKTLKHWLRKWKIELIEKNNPKWLDLYLTLQG